MPGAGRPHKLGLTTYKAGPRRYLAVPPLCIKPPGMTAPHQKTLLFLLTEDWFFASHFWVRAVAAQKAGWRVVLVARESEAAARIAETGIEVIPFDLQRRGLNPFKELRRVLRLARLYRNIKPDIVHHIALKPIILGGLAARLAGVRAMVNAPVGLGFVFSSDKMLAKLLRPAISLALRATLNPPRSRVIFENPDDLAGLAEKHMVKAENARLIRGAGVDMHIFAPAPEIAGPVRILLAARMIREKGVPEFVAAARILKGQAEFLLAGAPDPGNHDSLTEDELHGFEAEGLVRWLGKVRDMAQLLREVHVFCLPSTYREGLPKAVLEAMSSTKPVVATDIPGCREAVRDGETGFLVPPHDPMVLAQALKKLIDDPALRTRLGQAGRARVAAHFSDELICAATLAVYDELIPHKEP